MIRITELRLPIDHSAEDLVKKIIQRLKLNESVEPEFTVF